MTKNSFYNGAADNILAHLQPNSKFAKDADIILGIGVGEGDNARTLHVSKNKLNGWHGNTYTSIDIERGVFE